ncbi:hypothetical protein I302_104368 [Kwoniella bestiolae CBS 10118]|uniref:Uncharacterized protein n=1 Tax=Kwoniella bestiolae CBS 10118 TaxID=1296100 RepID=A0A1B9GB27_9TREE|nr:hypothetical protein I302_03076 [Kwoniella bestiolae CBS 10118]OCF28224.1 hypothetical protein I302_03076 [Kwoniella bestiolae CBS 10118]
MNKPLVDQYMHHGRRAMEEKDWEGAMQQFDKAISLNNKRNYTLLDLKVKAMTEIPEWHDSAYKTTEMMIADAPDDYRGYYRQARLLHKIGRLDAALRIMTKAIKAGPFKTQDERIYKSLQRYRSDLIFAQHENEQRRAAQSAEERRKIELGRAMAKKVKMNFINMLSPDVIINIAEAGSSNSGMGFIIRMAGVCRTWRNILLNTGSLWSTLTLGKKRVIERVRYILERSKNKVKEIIIRDDFDISRLTDISQLLKPHLKDVKRLTINGDVSRFSRFWQGEFKSLEYLKIKSTSFEVSDLVYRLLSCDCSSLKELDIEGGRYEHIYNYSYDLTLQAQATQNGIPVPQHRRNGDEEHDPPFWTEHSLTHLSGIYTLRLKNCTIYAAWTDHTELICHFPSLETFEMINITWDSTYLLTDTDSRAFKWNQTRSSRGLDISLDDLKTVSITGSTRNLGLYDIHAPNLKHLDLWSVHPIGSTSIAPLIDTPGLKDALGSLESLDIGRCTIDLNDLLDLLPRMPRLKFLNVSYCPLDNRFLEALERRGKEEDSVPNLMGLSISGNTEITSGPLRRFILSRTPQGIRSARNKEVVKKGSAFRPTPAKSSPFGPSRPYTQSQSSQKSFVPDSHPSTPSSSNVIQAQEAKEKHTPLPSIQWLCIDNCDRIEREFIDHIKTKVKYISNSYSTNMVESRIRGKGRYSWGLEWDIECGDGEGGCHLRKVAGSKDGYYIHHTCKKAIPATPTGEGGWSQLSQAQPSGTGSLGSMISSGSFAGF